MRVLDAIQPTSFSNIYDTKIETSLPDDDSGTEVNGYEEKDSVEEIAPPPLPAPYVPTPEPEEEEQELSGFASEMYVFYLFQFKQTVFSKVLANTILH